LVSRSKLNKRTSVGGVGEESFYGDEVSWGRRRVLTFCEARKERAVSSGQLKWKANQECSDLELEAVRQADV